MKIEEKFKLFALTEEMTDTFRRFADAPDDAIGNRTTYTINTIVLGKREIKLQGTESINAKLG